MLAIVCVSKCGLILEHENLCMGIGLETSYFS